MQKNLNIQTVCFLLMILLLVPTSLTGCGKQKDQDVPEITIDYLYNDYANQLISDGAELILGSIELSKNEDNQILMTVHPKELVTDEQKENGFQVVSYATNRDFTIPDHAYCTFFTDKKKSDPKQLSPEEFFTTVQEDYEENGNFMEYGDFKLYDIYVLDGQALLVLARNIY